MGMLSERTRPWFDCQSGERPWRSTDALSSQLSGEPSSSTIFWNRQTTCLRETALEFDRREWPHCERRVLLGDGWWACSRLAV